MGRGNRNQKGDHICLHCGECQDPAWKFCPYCHKQVPEPQAPQLAPDGSTQAQRLDPSEDVVELKTVTMGLWYSGPAPKLCVSGWLVGLDGKYKGKDFRIFEGKKTTIGSGDDCDIVIRDESVSNRHCTIRYDTNGNILLSDLDSANGTYVNEQRVHKSDIIDRDTIRLGEIQFKFISLE